MHKLGAVAIGAVVALGAWLLLVPWDLSEIDADGRMLDRGGDDHAGMIALVAGVVIAIGIGLVVSPRTRPSATWFVLGGLVMWTVLFAWRSAVSEVSGANMFMLPLVFAVIPLTIIAPMALRAMEHRLERSRPGGTSA